MNRGTLGLLLAVAAAAACSATPRGTPLPHVDAVVPDSVLLPDGGVVEVTIRGSGFTPGRPGRNTIVFGRAEITDVPASADGREIRLVVPDRLPSGGDAAPMPTEAGRYQLSVRTSAGSSNVIVMRVAR